VLPLLLAVQVAAADTALHLTGMSVSKYDNVVPPSVALGAKATVRGALGERHRAACIKLHHMLLHTSVPSCPASSHCARGWMHNRVLGAVLLSCGSGADETAVLIRTTVAEPEAPAASAVQAACRAPCCTVNDVVRYRVGHITLSTTPAEALADLASVLAAAGWPLVHRW
jgi:hypothetical protein